MDLIQFSEFLLELFFLELISEFRVEQFIIERVSICLGIVQELKHSIRQNAKSTSTRIKISKTYYAYSLCHQGHFFSISKIYNFHFSFSS